MLEDCEKVLDPDMNDFKRQLSARFDLGLTADADLRKIQDFFLFFQLKDDNIPFRKEEIETFENEFLEYMLAKLVILRSYEEDQMCNGFLQMIHNMHVDMEELTICFKQYVVNKNLLDSKTFKIDFHGADKLDCETQVNAVLNNPVLIEFKSTEPSLCRPSAKYFDTMIDEFIVNAVFSDIETTEAQKKDQLERLTNHFNTYRKYLSICSTIRNGGNK